eukprot:scaffold237599_cov37-Tisochrysis_lutea.AAC.1
MALAAMWREHKHLTHLRREAAAVQCELHDQATSSRRIAGGGDVHGARCERLCVARVSLSAKHRPAHLEDEVRLALEPSGEEEDARCGDDLGRRRDSFFGGVRRGVSYIPDSE